MSSAGLASDGAARTARLIVCSSLLLDLFAFACPLPLFPRIIDECVAFLHSHGTRWNVTAQLRRTGGVQQTCHSTQPHALLPSIFTHFSVEKRFELGFR